MDINTFPKQGCNLTLLSKRNNKYVNVQGSKSKPPNTRLWRCIMVPIKEISEEPQEKSC